MAAPPRSLGAPTATLLVVASMIGTGVFTTTGFLVRDLGDPWAVLAGWAVGAVIALAGALSYAELSAALPVSGGEYALLTRIYHPAVGFVAGWISFVVGFSAPAAAAAMAFASYLAAVWPGLPRTPAALGLLAALSALHAARVPLAAGAQNLLTSVKLALVLGVTGLGWWAGHDAGLPALEPAALGRALLSPSFAVALIFVTFAYSGWNAATYVAGELRHPARTVPLSLALGTLAVGALYLALNAGLLAAAPLTRLAGRVDVAHAALAPALGPWAERALSAAIAGVLVSSVGALVLAGPRVYEAMGVDHPRLARLVRPRPGRGPRVAIALQLAASSAMVITSTFDALLTWIGVTLSLSSGLTVLGVLVLRHRRPDLPRPYRVLGHPVTPLAFVGFMVWIVVHTLRARPGAGLAALLTVAMGLGLWRILGGAHPRRQREGPGGSGRGTAQP